MENRKANECKFDMIGIFNKIRNKIKSNLENKVEDGPLRKVRSLTVGGLVVAGSVGLIGCETPQAYREQSVNKAVRYLFDKRETDRYYGLVDLGDVTLSFYLLPLPSGPDYSFAGFRLQFKK